MALEHWEIVQRQQGNIAGAEKALALRKRYGDVPLPSAESQVEVRRFSQEERKALLGDGAVIYLLTGETIRDQREDKRPLWYVVGGYSEHGKNRVLDFPSRLIEVAIYPHPEGFFVPGSFGKTTDGQDSLLVQEAEGLRKKLRVGGITMIRPEASEATEVFFKHFDAAGARLLGKDYMDKANGYWRYIRTNTPTNLVGSSLASVGRWHADSGLLVDGWPRDEGRVLLGVARWVVPQRT